MGRSRIFFLPLLVVVFTWGLGPAAVLAQEKKVETIYKLSLDEATQVALENNFDIQLAKYDAWISQTDKDVARSIYDTLFETEVEYRNNQRQQSSTLLGNKTVDNDYNIGTYESYARICEFKSKWDYMGTDYKKQFNLTIT